MGQSRIPYKIPAGRRSSSTLNNLDAMERQKSKGSGGEAIDIPPPVRIPGVGPNENILPAEADERDRQREGEGGEMSATPAASAADLEGKKPSDIYDRFSPARKRAILAIVSYSAFISRE